MAILDEIKERKATASIAGGVLIVALVAIWLQARPATLQVNHVMIAGIGQVAAAETAAAVRDHGQVLAVINVNYTMAGPLQETWQAFQRELKKHPGITLLTPVKAEVDPGDSQTGCSSRDFKNLMEQNADVDAIVFFVSLPEWGWLRQNQRIPQRLPPQVVVVDTGALPAQGHYASYFANGFVSLLIAPRSNAAPTKPGGPQTGREWFDKYYQVFTPANFESLTE